MSDSEHITPEVQARGGYNFQRFEVIRTFPPDQQDQFINGLMTASQAVPCERPPFCGIEEIDKKIRQQLNATYKAAAHKFASSIDSNYNQDDPSTHMPVVIELRNTFYKIIRGTTQMDLIAGALHLTDPAKMPNM